MADEALSDNTLDVVTGGSSGQPVTLESRLAGLLKVLDRVTSVFGVVAQSCLFIMMMAAVVDIVSTQILRRPIYLAYEMVSVVLVLVVWLSISGVQSKHKQISVPVLYERMSPRGRQFMDLFFSLTALVFSVAVAAMGTIRLQTSFAQGEVLPMGFFPLPGIRLGFVIGVYLLVIVSLAQVAAGLLRVIPRRAG